MITIIRRAVRRILSRIFHCCEKCGKTATDEVYLRKAGTLIFKSVYICQSCQDQLWEISIAGECLVQAPRENSGNNKVLSLKRKKA